MIKLESGEIEKCADTIPTVSWLLCTHVADNQLYQALESCLNQTFTDFELLVVVNGPLAGKVAATVRLWFGADSRLRVWTTDIRHLTFSLALGLHHARADLIARMDSDDMSHPDRLERQVDFMLSHPDVTVLGTAYDLIDSNGLCQNTVLLPTEDNEIRKALLLGNPLCHPSVMFRRAKVLAIGGYLGGIYAQDYDLWVRLAGEGNNRFANLRDVCLSYRSTGIGQARRSRFAYASLATIQLRNFLIGAGFVWGWAALLSIAKLFVRSLSFFRTGVK